MTITKVFFDMDRHVKVSQPSSDESGWKWVNLTRLILW